MFPYLFIILISIIIGNFHDVGISPARAFDGLFDGSSPPKNESDSISNSTPIDLQASSPASTGAVPLMEPLTQIENLTPSPPSTVPVAQVAVPTAPSSIVTSSSASIHSYGHPRGSYSFSGRQERESYQRKPYFPDDHHHHRHSSQYDHLYDYYSPTQ